MQAGSKTITLAFNLSAVEALTDPKEVITNAYAWADNIGILTEEPLDRIVDFKQGYKINTDFTSGPRSLPDSLEDTYGMIATDRHIYVGVTDEHQELAEDANWEFIHISDAAASADWELNEDALDRSLDDTDTTGLELPDDERDSIIEIDMPTHQWHLIKRDEKHIFIRPVTEELNRDTIAEDDTVILRRGLYEQHKIAVTIDWIEYYDDLETLIENIDLDEARPNLNEDPLEKLTQKHGEKDEYFAFGFTPHET